MRIVGQPAYGAVTLAGSVATYIPNPGYIGPDSFTYAASDSGGYVDSATPGVISVTVGSPTTLATLDSDGDGLSDLLEYALGLSPDFPSVTTATTPVFQSVSGQNYLSLSVPRAFAPSDVTLGIEVSSDMLTWQPAVVTSNTPWLFEARDPSPMSASNHRFIRLKATR